MSLHEATDLKLFIEKCSVDKNNNEKILEKLEELGVQNTSDLGYLNESDLKDVLKPVHIRKLLGNIRELQARKQPSPAMPSGSNDACILLDTPPSIPRPQRQSDFHNFDVMVLINSKMPELKVLFESGQRLQTDARRKFVREVVDEMRKGTKNCVKKHFEFLANTLVNMYPDTFEDRIGVMRIGTGYDSLMTQFISRNENLNRKSSPSVNVTKGTEPRSVTVTKRKSSLFDTDSYGCVSWGPNMNTEDEEKQETIRMQLMEMYGAPGCNWDAVYAKMHDTFALQRKHINQGTSLQQLRVDWPFLIEETALLTHCKLLLGIDLCKAIENAFINKAPRLLKFFLSKQSRSAALAKCVSDVQKAVETDATALIPGLILCLQKSLGEKGMSLFFAVDEMSSNEEVEKANTESWPRLAMLGDSILSAKQYRLVVDFQVIGHYASFVTALTVGFGAYYTFNIEYPSSAAATLEFIQRCFIGINPNTGLKITKKKRSVGVNSKVLSLINELADFEWTDQS